MLERAVDVLLIISVVTKLVHQPWRTAANDIHYVTSTSVSGIPLFEIHRTTVAIGYEIAIGAGRL